MTAENNGNGAAPEGGEDDPFAYLYRQEDGSGAQQPPTQQPGVPRRSYNQVRAVGERQYGYGYPQQPQRPQQQPPPPPNQQPSAHYAAPETVPGGRRAARQQAAGSDGYVRGGRSRTGLMVGAIAVVAAVVIGIGAAIVFNEDTGANAAETKGDDTSQQAGDENDNKGEKDNKPEDKPSPKALPKEDAASFTLGGGATAAKDVPNAKGTGGAYVGGMNKPGASATWEMKDLPQAGKYTLHVRYGVPGEDADTTLSVNGEAQDRPLSMKNWAGAEKGDWAKGWATTWSNVQLKKGQNSVKISCEDGNKCNVNLDQVWLKKGWK